MIIIVHTQFHLQTKRKFLYQSFLSNNNFELKRNCLVGPIAIALHICINKNSSMKVIYIHGTYIRWYLINRSNLGYLISLSHLLRSGAVTNRIFLFSFMRAQHLVAIQYNNHVYVYPFSYFNERYFS